MKRLLLFYLLFFLPVKTLRLAAQTNKIDSLRKITIHSSVDKERLEAFLLLSEQGGSMNIDSLDNYIAGAEEIAVREHDETSLVRLQYTIAGAFARKGLLDSAFYITDNVLNKYPKEYKNRNTWLLFAMQKGRLYDRSNQYTKAITQLSEVLDAAEQWNNTLIQVQASTGIGWVEMETEQYKEALNWFYKALHISTNSVFLKEYIPLYSNIASVYNKIGNNDSAEMYIDKAIKLGREAEALTYLATSLTIAADIYTKTGRKEKVEAVLNEAVQIRKQINDPYYTVYDMSRLANWYAHDGKTAKGIELCMAGIEMASRSGLSSQLLLIYYALAENYKVAGNNTLYSKTLEKIITLKDSFSTINSSNLLTKLQAKYNVKEQQNTIMQQKLDLSEKNNIVYGVLALLLLTGVVSYFIFRDHRRKHKLKVVRMQEEEKKIAGKAVQEAEEKERKRIAADLHDNLGAYANAVLHGTELLQQENTVVHNKELVKDLNNSSKEIITSLRETIWALKKENYTAEECLLRIRNFIQLLNRHYEHINFEVRGSAPENFFVHYSKALHLVRMLQEAITNAIKHAEAEKIIVVSNTGDQEWRLQVQDDGKGFSGADTVNGNEHNGLTNLEERAKASGIGLVINSQQGIGTTVELMVKGGINQ